MSENSKMKILTNGILNENPVLRLVLGTCPTLAVTTMASNGIGMGLAATFVLLCSNIVISALRKVIPDQVRIPCYITVIAGFVSVVQMVVKAFVPDLDKALGVYLPLIVVNCIILGRAESYASKNPPLPSIFDGIGMGLGFTVGLTAIGIVREVIGAGKAFGFQLLPLADSATGKAGYVPVTIFILAPGAFLVLAGLTALQNKVKNNAKKKGKKVTETVGCGEGCASCTNSACGGKIFPTGNEKE